MAQYRIETVQAKQGVDQSAVAYQLFWRADQSFAKVAAKDWQSANQSVVAKQVNVASNSLTDDAHGGREF